MCATFFDAFTRIGPRVNTHGAHPWALAHLIDEMEHCSISAALVASTACVQYDAALENRRLSALLADHDDLFPVWNVLPHWTGEFPAPDHLLAQLRDQGVRAVTLYPRTNGWDLFSRYSRPLLAALAESRTLTILDCRSEIDPAGVEALAVGHPGLPLLLIGVSWAQQRLITPLLLHHRNLHVAFDHLQANRGVERLVELGCARQVLFASNAPEMAMGAHRCYLDYAEISDDTRALIAGENLVRLLHGQAPPRDRCNAAEDSLMADARQGRPITVPVIDFHAHILDEGLNGAGGSYTMWNGGPDGIGAMARRLGIDGIGVMSWNGTVGVHAAQGNDCVRDALDRLPPDCWGLATVDVARNSPEAIRSELETIFADARFLGLKPYPHYGLHYDHAAYRPVWEFGNERGLYALIHANRVDLSELDALCPAYPRMTFVAAHCGASYQAADYAIAMAQRHENCLLEVTLTPVCLGIIDYLVTGAGVDRVLFGTDQPMRDPRQQLGWIVFSRLSPDDKCRVLGGNALALLARIRRSLAAVAASSPE